MVDDGPEQITIYRASEWDYPLRKSFHDPKRRPECWHTLNRGYLARFL